MEKRLSLHVSGLEKLEIGRKVYVISYDKSAFTFKEVPALAAGYDGKYFSFVYIGTNAKAEQIKFPLSQYEKTWHVEIDDGVSVKTPSGIIHAFAVGSTEVPPIIVNLVRSDHDVPIRLAMMEYCPSAGLVTRVSPDDWHSMDGITIQHRGRIV